jgi:signal transduction histidine kinase
VKKYRILVVEDESIVAKDIQNTLIDLDYEVVGIASTSEKAVALALEKKPDLILMDIMLNGQTDGIETSKIIHEKIKIPIVFLTAYSDGNTLNKAKEIDPSGYIIKPFHGRDLYTSIEMAMYKREMEIHLDEANAERLRLFEAEKVARAEAEMANRAKDFFLALVSHELRNPLTTILGWTQILKKNINNPEKILYGVSIIERNAAAQELIVNDLLDTSRIITGKLSLTIQENNLRSILENSIDSVRPEVDEKKIEMHLDFKHINDTINADASRLQQVFCNILINAKKFTPESGKITIQTKDSFIPSKPNIKAVEIDFIDTGIGIASDFLPKIFDRFSQVNQVVSKKSGGLGLGLSLVKNLIELHGGEVLALSDGEGKGSTFKIFLPHNPYFTKA